MEIKNKKQEELQQKYMQLQMIEAQLQQGEKELNQLELKRREVEALKDSLGELKNIKTNSKSFSPLGLGIFAEGSIKNTKELLVQVGAGVVVKKKVEDVKKVLEQQMDQFRIISGNLMQNMQLMAMQAQALEKQLAEAVKE